MSYAEEAACSPFSPTKVESCDQIDGTATRTAGQALPLGHWTSLAEKSHSNSSWKGAVPHALTTRLVAGARRGERKGAIPTPNLFVRIDPVRS
jgi:hypothetical protein